MSYRDDTLTGQPLTDREAEMLKAHDAGKTASDLAEMFGYASANGAGNVVRRALTKVGRGGEVRAGGGGGGTRKPTVTENAAEQSMRDLIDRMGATIDGLRERLSTIEADVDATPAAIVKSETERLEGAVKTATERLEAFRSMEKAEKDAFVASHRERAKARADAERDSIAESITKAEAERDKAERMLAVLTS